MNPVLAEIIQSKLTQLPDGRDVPVHSGVGTGTGRLLRQAIEATAPATACEVGLAFGLSTLHILDAMQRHGGGRLIGIDPAQHDGTWQGGGLHNVRRAGFADRYEFHEATSQQVLPKLVEAGTKIQFAFLDGWHTFDHTLVDFFYVDTMLDVGGIVVLDDVGYPGLQRLSHFLVSNRDYSLVDFEPSIVPSGWRVNAKAFTQRLLAPLVRDNHSPNAHSSALEARVNRASVVALQKNGMDRRRFDHFIPF